jgi:hypothetical protein
MRASKRKGMGWKRWSRKWLYDRVGLFNDYRRVRLQQFPKANPMPNVPLDLAAKQTGKPTAGNPHGGFDAAGTGNGYTVRLLPFKFWARVPAYTK